MSLTPSLVVPLPPVLPPTKVSLWGSGTPLDLKSPCSNQVL
jgi:hypothetical protein